MTGDRRKKFGWIGVVGRRGKGKFRILRRRSGTLSQARTAPHSGRPRQPKVQAKRLIDSWVRVRAVKALALVGDVMRNGRQGFLRSQGKG